MKKTPHFLLFSGTEEPSANPRHQAGSWYFQLESTHGGPCLQASDVEVDVSAERLELLAVVRGLEALDQPSRVTLMTNSPEVSQGIRHGLPRWRADGWTWEQLGRPAPLDDQDLWQRIDRAVRIHRVDCRCFRFDPAHAGPPRGHCAKSGPDPSAARVPWSTRCLTGRPVRALSTLGRSFAAALHKMADWLQRVLPENSPTPHPMT